jgi:phage shock protein A
MKQDDADAWHGQMMDLQADLAKRAVDEVNRLRKRVRELEAQIAAGPVTAYELQERITMLELELAKLRAAGVGGPDHGR